MVFTDLLLNDSTPELRKFPFGVLAAQPDEVAADLVPKILATSGNGQKVEFLTTDRVLTKFFNKFVLGEKSKCAAPAAHRLQHTPLARGTRAPRGTPPTPAAAPRQPRPPTGARLRAASAEPAPPLRHTGTSTTTAM